MAFEKPDACDADDFPVDVSRHGDGFVLTVGPVSIWFGRRTAEEIMSQLGEALEMVAPLRSVATASN